MSLFKKKVTWSDPVWRIIKASLLLWGIGQGIWLYFAVDQYSLFAASVYFFIALITFSLWLQREQTEN